MRASLTPAPSASVSCSVPHRISFSLAPRECGAGHRWLVYRLRIHVDRYAVRGRLTHPPAARARGECGQLLAVSSGVLSHRSLHRDVRGTSPRGPRSMAVVPRASPEESPRVDCPGTLIHAPRQGDVARRNVSECDLSCTGHLTAAASSAGGQRAHAACRGRVAPAQRPAHRAPASSLGSNFGTKQHSFYFYFGLIS